jgi:predicted ArsR family transcriptional regulator
MSADFSKIRPPRTAAVRRTRDEHAQETAQDYVELIAELIVEAGEARAIDLARRLGVTHVTVGRTIQRLQREASSRPSLTARSFSPRPAAVSRKSRVDAMRSLSRS